MALYIMNGMDDSLEEVGLARGFDLKCLRSLLFNFLDLVLLNRNALCLGKPNSQIRSNPPKPMKLKVSVNPPRLH